MRHRNKIKSLGRKKAPRELMLRNLASSILIYEKVKTTKAKARAVKPLLERVITYARKNDLAAKKRIIEIIPQKLAAKKAIEVIGARYKDRKGGYTRVTKLGMRQGDAAEIVQIELV
ncbi:MAG: 50S ribosomal protein L17 [Patescibacteria group bacterium]|jgi:large subunit ribosomal protein L17